MVNHCDVTSRNMIGFQENGKGGDPTTPGKMIFPALRVPFYSVNDIPS